MPTRVAVFFDWQNVYEHARGAFGLKGAAGRRGTISPVKAARVLAAGHGRDPSATSLTLVECHRGWPSSGRDPLGHGAVARQANDWRREGAVDRLRPLAYREDDLGNVVAVEEKGVDVQLACSVHERLGRNDCEVAVVFSHDSDLKPLVESVVRLYGGDRIETASWWSEDHRTQIPPTRGVFNQALSERVFQAVETAIDYRRRRKAR